MPTMDEHERRVALAGERLADARRVEATTAEAAVQAEAAYEASRGTPGEGEALKARWEAKRLAASAKIRATIARVELREAELDHRAAELGLNEEGAGQGPTGSDTGSP